MKYITCEGRFSIIYGYHFGLLHELRYGMDLPPARKLSIPYFLLQSLIECGTKLNEGIPDQLAHHGLIKLLVEDSLHTYTVPISWKIFRNMSRDDDIRTLVENITPSSSDEGEKTKEIEKNNDEGAQDNQVEGKTEEGQKEKEEFGKTAKPKTEKETKTKTTKEKRTQIGKEKAEKAQNKAATAKSGTQQEKEKTHPEISVTKIETVDTEISTGSEGKEQQQEESPEKLAREVAAMLAALSTLQNKKEK